MNATKNSVRELAVQPATAEPISGIVIGRVTEVSNERGTHVSFNVNSENHCAPARSLVTLAQADIGRQVALMFESGNLQHPTIIGLLHANTPLPAHCVIATAGGEPVRVTSAGDEVTIVAQRKLTLQCGMASITLDVDGTVEIRGDNLLSRAAGQNRIKGSSISLN